MIDTIVLNIHNLRKYEQILNSLDKGKGNAQTTFAATPKNAATLENKEVHYVLHHDSRNFRRILTGGHKHISSSGYNLYYIPDFVQDVLKFNFSIPKYKYGTNVHQFINYYEQNSRATFCLLLDFLRDFSKSFIQVIDPQDIEICQIDFCYNQFFDSKESAITYQRGQIPILQKLSRINGKASNIYQDESFMLSLQRYTIKVYHKGSEFRKHDYKELLKAGNNTKHNLDRMADIADRILRYEVSYRSKFFNDAFKAMYIKGNDFSGQGTMYRYLNKVVKINKGKTPNKHFFLRSKYDVIDNIKKSFSQHPKKEYWINEFIGYNDATFDQRMFDKCYNHFWSFFKKFQLNTSGSVDTLKKMIAQINFNESVKHTLSKRKFEKKNEDRLLFWAVLSQKNSLKDLVKNGTLSRSGYYKIMSSFKKAGLKDYNPKLVATKPALGYQDYKYFFGSFH